MVDCPTCGRAVRVPNLDGTIAPLPRPGLNLQDARLAEALQELANIGHGEVSIDGDDDEEASDAAEPLTAPVLAPAPRPMPVPIEPPQPVEPQPLEPIRFVPAGRAGAETLPESLDDRAVAAELAQLAAAPQPAPQAAAPITPRWSRADWLVAGACLAGSFALGFLVARWTMAGTTNAAPATAQPAAPESPQPTAPEPAGMTSGLFGRITYKTADGQSRPDGGARIIVLPQPWSGTDKLPAAPFVAAPASSEFTTAAAALQQQGGGVAVADDDGRYQLALPNPGSFGVLVLSHYQPGDGHAAGLRDHLDAAFDRPDRLLGERAAAFGPLRYAGHEPVVWDHSFPPTP